jgi:hypothetical protein
VGLNEGVSVGGEDGRINGAAVVGLMVVVGTKVGLVSATVGSELGD